MTDKILEKKIAEMLAEGGIESNRFEAVEIMASADSEAEVLQMVAERLQRRPLQYILGEWEFFGLPFKVGEGVLIPRPDTEILVETAQKFLKDKSCPEVLDICAGSGCIGISLAARNNAKATFIEKSDDAIKFLKENLALNKVDAKVCKMDVLQCDDFGVFEQDMVISNPPYIRREVLKDLEPEVKCEPLLALDGGEDGLIFYKEIAKKAKSSLKDGGCLAFEIGFDQREAVESILIDQGYKQVNSVKDYGGNDRVVYGIYKTNLR